MESSADAEAKLIKDFADRLATALRNAADAGLKNLTQPKGREAAFQEGFVRSMLIFQEEVDLENRKKKDDKKLDGGDDPERKYLVAVSDFEVHQTPYVTEGGTGSDINIGWKVKRKRFWLHLQLKVLYTDYTHYLNSLNKSLTFLAEDSKAEKNETNKERLDARIKRLTKTIAAASNNLEGAKWQKGKAWFDVQYQSKADDTEGVYQALALQDTVSLEVERNENSRAAFLTFVPPPPPDAKETRTIPTEASLIPLSKLTALFAKKGDTKIVLSAKHLESLNKDQMEVLVNSGRMRVVPKPMPFSDTLLTWLKKWLME